MKKYIRKITKKSNYSYVAVIPKQIIAKLGWKERQKVVFRLYGKGKILISDWKKKTKQ